MKQPSVDAGTRLRRSALSAAVTQTLRDMSEASRRAYARGLKPAVFAASGSAILATALAVTPANVTFAQDAAPVDEITVTGSRIRRQDFTANAPITTIDQTTFENTSTIGVETVLNQLPQFVPAVTQFSTGDVQNTAINTVGASTVSLRGLGANRNLVLINGRRGQPVNSTMVVDTNMIPSSAIQRVEVISGGASAVYGADAVGGVVNFILKDNFEGATVETRFGDTQHGGNQEYTISTLLGANVAGGRGNVMVGLEQSSRTKQYQWERDWRLDDLRNPNITGTHGFLSETWVTNPSGTIGNAVNRGVVNSLFSEAVPCPATGPCPAGSVANTATFFVNRTPDGSGTVFTGGGGLFGANGIPGAYRYTGGFEDPYGQFPGLPWRKLQPDGRITENALHSWSSTPLDRYSAFGRGVFNVSDNTRVTAQVLFGRTETQTNLGLTSDALGALSARVPFGDGVYEPSLAGDGISTLPAYQAGGTYGLNCPPTGGCTNSQAFPVPEEIALLFGSRANPDMDIAINRPLDFLRAAMGEGRKSNNTTTTMQLQLGMEGELPSGNHFWDVALSHGSTTNLIGLGGAARLEAWRALVQSPNYGVGFLRAGNPEGGGFQSGIATCQTGLSIFRDFMISQDCVNMLAATLQNQQEVDQTTFEANLVGTLAEMNAGPLQYALGTTYREASFRYVTDNLTRNESFADMPMGIFPTANAGGEFDVSEIYGELLIPIVSNGPTGIHHFNVELGGRVSDFSTVGSVETFKGLIDWAFTPRYRLRGGFNRAHRAPNLGELFLVRSQTFGGTGGVFGDQCSQNSLEGPYSANPNSNINGAQGALHAEAICRQLMGPTGAFEYYDNRNIEDQPETGGQGLPNTTGNPNLSEERADTFTMGLVMNLFDSWTLTLDYYTIEISDMIARENGDAVFERCLSLATNPNADITNPACASMIRNPANGNPASIDLFFTNTGWTRTSGVDVQVNWRHMLRSGGLNVTMLANYNLKNETRAAPGLTKIDWVGTAGCDLQMQCMGYDYRIFTTVNYFRNQWGISLRNQFWPSRKSGAFATNPNTTARNVSGSYALFALAGNYRFNDRFTLRAGIENLFDRDPPRSGGNPLATAFPTVGTRAGGGTYDPLGRRGFVTMVMDF
jgi:iron complex outermembrane recepter protein